MIESKSNKIDDIYSWIKSIVFAFLIALLVRHFLFSPTVVLGESMLPTFEKGDIVLINKLSDIQRFDIVVFEAPDAKELYVKRVIGLPGDTIEVIDDVLYINGDAIHEPYLDDNRLNQNVFGNFTKDFTLQEMTGKTKVPEKSFFVLGDNRINSKDSRSFGFIREESLIGEVKLRIYPLDKLGLPK